MSCSSNYMSEPWYALLRDQCQRRSQTAVAIELGISVSTVNQVLRCGGLYGSGQADTTRIANRVIHTYGRYPCPYLTQENGGEPVVITAEQCRAYAHRPAPTTPREMQHWQACRTCEHFIASAPPAVTTVRKTKAQKETTRDI
ncbi:MAG: hypothetical protein LT082_08820 [Comamonas sp.]|nr:hypothetical protein [Comamonas sp.]